MARKEYTVYFQGKMTVEADDEREATNDVYDHLSEVAGIEFNITSTEEEKDVQV
jgi:hypothetical protein